MEARRPERRSICTAGCAGSTMSTIQRFIPTQSQPMSGLKQWTPVQYVRRMWFSLLLVGLLLCTASSALAETRALLVSCSRFLTHPNLGNAVSGNLEMLEETFLGAGLPQDNVTVMDGNIGDIQSLQNAIMDAFSEAAERDLSILYICTHGFDADEDHSAHLVLSDGTQEDELTGEELMSLIESLDGEVLLMIDACHSGAMFGRGGDMSPLTLPEHVHALTSALGNESAWYYAHERMEYGAISYFAQALCSGLGLYGALEADIDGDGTVSLWELYSWLRRSVASSTCQLISSNANLLLLPCFSGTGPSMAVEGFSCGSQLISSSNTSFRFSFNVQRDTSIQYRLTEYRNGHWDWENQILISDSETTGVTGRGSKTRTLNIDPENRSEDSYLIFQLFTFENNVPQLCAERLLAIQSEQDEAFLSMDMPILPAFSGAEIPIFLRFSSPAVFRLSIYNEAGSEIRRLFYGEITRAASGNRQYLTWDGRDETGNPVPAGYYRIQVISVINGERCQAETSLYVAEQRLSAAMLNHVPNHM